MKDDDELRHIHEVIDMYRMEYEKAVAPYFKMLADYHSLKAPEPVFLSQEEAKRFGFYVDTKNEHV